jgi:hypothetical protein
MLKVCLVHEFPLEKFDFLQSKVAGKLDEESYEFLKIARAIFAAAKI